MNKENRIPANKFQNNFAAKKPKEKKEEGQLTTAAAKDGKASANAPNPNASKSSKPRFSAIVHKVDRFGRPLSDPNATDFSSFASPIVPPPPPSSGNIFAQKVRLFWAWSVARRLR